MHGLSGDNTGSLKLNSLALVGNDGTKTVDGLTEGVKHTAEKAITDGDVDDGSSSLNDVTFLDLSVSYG